MPHILQKFSKLSDYISIFIIVLLYIINLFEQNLNSKFVRNTVKCYVDQEITNSMRNTYCLVQIEFITEFTNVQHVIITQI
jgi:hypothetical protein